MRSDATEAAISSLDTKPLDIIIFQEPEWIRRWTVQEYHRMAEAEILSPDERTELIAGHIFLMAAKGMPHVVALGLLAELLRNQLGEAALVRTQDPIQLDDYSEPEPDLAVVQGGILDYFNHHPHPSEIYLLVEVADSTLKHDCEVKNIAYAQAGIPEYWVLDVKTRQLHIFLKPTSTGYANHIILNEPASITPLAFAEISISLAAILPPTS